jgi:hypothetical protein
MKLRRSDIARAARWFGSIFEKAFITPSCRSGTRAASPAALCVGTRPAAAATRIPMLARMVERDTAESFDLNNSVSIEIGTASFRSARGYTIVAALCDEVPFWMSEDSANPDFEILDALRPGMATIPNAMLLCASSPYAKRGALHDAHKRYYAKARPDPGLEGGHPHHESVRKAETGRCRDGARFGRCIK